MLQKNIIFLSEEFPGNYELKKIGKKRVKVKHAYIK